MHITFDVVNFVTYTLSQKPVLVNVNCLVNAWVLCWLKRDYYHCATQLFIRYYMLHSTLFKTIQAHQRQT